MTNKEKKKMCAPYISYEIFKIWKMSLHFTESGSQRNCKNKAYTILVVTWVENSKS